jgi:hypothetical protein
MEITYLSELKSNELEALVLEALDNLTNKATLDTVGLDLLTQSRTVRCEVLYKKIFRRSPPPSQDAGVE